MPHGNLENARIYVRKLCLLKIKKNVQVTEVGTELRISQAHRFNTLVK